MKRPLRAAVGAALVLGVVAFGLASLWIGRGVKLAVETVGPRVVGAPVTVGVVALAPWSGRGTIRGFIVGNPAGFKGEKALSVGSVEVALKLSSLATDTIVIERLVIRRPELAYELGAGGSNIARLQRNASGGGSAASGSSKSVLIRELVVTDGKVSLAATGLGGRKAEAALPDLRLTNLGGKGRPVSETAAEVLGAVSGSAAKAVSGLGSRALDGAASAALGALGGLLKGGKK